MGSGLRGVGGVALLCGWVLACSDSNPPAPGALDGGGEASDAASASPPPRPDAGPTPRDAAAPAPPPADAGPGSCLTSLDCVDAAGGRTICNVAFGRCDECVVTADCGDDEDCVDFACVAFTPCENSLDCELGDVCDASRGRCVECVGDADCDDGEACAASTCRAVCDSDNDCTPMGLLCDLARGHCAECAQHSDCRADRHCAEGRCAADVCVPDSGFCDGRQTNTCTAVGDAVVVTECAARQTCVESGQGASCEPWVCTAGQAECMGDQLVECAADGLSVTQLTDCTQSGGVCVSGECRPLACTPSAAFCDGGTVRTCAADGLTSTLTDTCMASEYCDTASATCVPGVCAPGQPACDGAIATTCNAVGDGYAAGGTDCSSSGDVCVAGSCEPQICTPSALSCVGGDVARCNATGTQNLTEQVCTSNQYCDDSSVAACVAQVCTPNAPGCVGNVATACDAIGSGYLGGGTDCLSEVCVSGACEPLLCTPSTYFCLDGDVWVCNGDGMQRMLYDTCAVSEYCSPGVSLCQPQVCAPGEPACNGDVATTCNADGSGYVAGGTDCAALDDPCVDGACVPCDTTNGGVEVCDGVDNDCDGVADDGAVCRSGCAGARYQDTAYMFCTTARNWLSAELDCQAAGMHLARVDSAAEETWIESQRVGNALSQVWLGGSDRGTEGDWRWIGGDAFWSGGTGGSGTGLYVNWEGSVPQPDDASGEDCLVYPYGSGTAWEDLGCELSHDYVCEEYVATTGCYDVVQNGSETGVDCGGSCPACSCVAASCPSCGILASTCCTAINTCGCMSLLIGPCQ